AVKCCVSTARTKALSAMPLPLWDDFSYASDSVIYPLDTLWETRKSVWVNNGRGINSPSIGVATFDGIDSLGKPYSVNDILAKGIADRLVSRPLRMDLVDVLNRESVYLSFYFQYRGNGEPPDAGDQLIVSIKNNNDKWNIIKVIENDGTLEDNKFYSSILLISGDQYFYDGFQFRFESFGRLSGPYDTWNLDYVYINQGRSPVDTSYPDRTITTSPTSLFNKYYSMPLRHFLLDPVSNTIKPSVSVFNLKSINDSDPSLPPDEQPFNYTTTATINTVKNKELIESVTVDLDTKQEPGFNISPISVSVLTVKTTPTPDLFNSNADSIHILFKLGLSTKDNETPEKDGDYDVLKYQPIDFRYNDTTRAEYILSDYYAYDDGTAEYGASLVQPGSMMAYLFELNTNKLDTLVRVDMYFPKFGDETSQVMQLQILRDLTNSPGSLFYTENITIQRSQQNKMWRHTLTRPIGIDKKFYIALKQISSTIIAIGLDKNTDSGDKMFFNSNGTWSQNVNVKGSLMIRPAFGKGDSVNTAINEPTEIVQRAYPNPSTGTFFVPASTELVQIVDMTGRIFEHEESTWEDQKRIEIKFPIPGIYVLKLFKKQKVTAQKIMVRQ
ncbi:MAG: T9SS type A sorting domain-containing protein, partial [Bacteroidia bacterium]|nr:T9SS type A sorting domain-containing protein [Bacteroidia bacterium]